MNLEKCKREVPIQYYAEIMLGIDDWRQLGSGLLTPKVNFRQVNANDYSSLVIDPETNRFWRNSGKGRNPEGTIVDFICNVEDCDIKDAILKLQEFVDKYLPQLNIEENQFDDIKPKYRSKKKKKNEKSLLNVSPDFTLPGRSKNNHRVFSYMIKKRKIEKEIYDYFINNNFLYQDFKACCCFVSYDDNGIPVFGCIRDTNWNKRITYGVTGSSVNHAFYINNHSNILIVTEAVVDAMALMSIFYLDGKIYDKYNYLALTGTKKIEAIKYHVEQDPTIDTIFLGFDNDDAGKQANEKAKELLKNIGWTGTIKTLKPSYGKDFNDALIHKKEVNDF